MDIRYYYFRDSLRRPLVTLAMVRNDEGIVGYGWSICASTDQCSKDDTLRFDAERQRWIEQRGGKSIARGRAEAALRRGKQLADGVWSYKRPIERCEAVNTIADCHADAVLALANLDADALVMLPRSMQPPPALETYVPDTHVYGALPLEGYRLGQTAEEMARPGTEELPHDAGA